MHIPGDLASFRQQKTPCPEGRDLCASSRTAALLSAHHWTLDAACGGALGFLQYKHRANVRDCYKQR